MQVPNAELRPLHVHRQVHLTTPRQVLDIAVSSMLWSAGNRSCALFTDLLLDVLAAGTDVNGLRVRRQRYDALEMRVCRDELSLTLVPCRQYLRRRCTAQNAGMDEACETNARDVAGRAEDAFEVPDGLRTACPESAKVMVEVNIFRGPTPWDIARPKIHRRCSCQRYR